MATPFELLSKELQMSPEETSVFLELTSHGDLTSSEIAHFTGLSDKVINSILSELLKKEYAYSYQNDHDDEIHYKSPSEAQILELFKDNEQLLTLLHTYSPRIGKDSRIGILRYEGWKGIRKVYLEVLAEAIRTHEEIIAFENLPDKEQTPIGADFLDSYLQSRLENKVVAKVITTDTEASRKYLQDRHEQLTKVKIIPDLELEGTINVVGSVVMSYSTHPPRGTLRYDKAEAHDLKNIFHVLWRSN